jgi:hypothetical protein
MNWGNAWRDNIMKDFANAGASSRRGKKFFSKAGSQRINKEILACVLALFQGRWRTWYAYSRSGQERAWNNQAEKWGLPAALLPSFYGKGEQGVLVLLYRQRLPARKSLTSMSSRYIASLGYSFGRRYRLQFREKEPLSLPWIPESIPQAGKGGTYLCPYGRDPVETCTGIFIRSFAG